MLQILSFAKSKMAIGTVVFAVAALSFAGVFAPREGRDARAEQCANPPAEPAFNIYPVTYTGSTGCEDLPLTRMRTLDGQYPMNSAELNAGLTLQSGQEAFVAIYIHNGGATNLPESQTTAKDVRVSADIPTTTGTTRTAHIKVTALNADGIEQFYKINTGANDHIEIVPGSGERYDNNYNLIDANFNMGNNILAIGDMKSCFEHLQYFRFRIKAVSNTPPTPTNTTISINKEVRDLTKNTSFAKNVTVDSGNQVEYRIRVTNTGSSTAKAVFITDSLSNTGINPTGSITVDRTYTGSLANGLGIGDIAVNSTATITYRANVTKDSITVTNTAVASASNAPTVQSSAVVDVPAPSKGNLTIVKNVRSLNGSFQKSVTVQNNETVEYRIVVGVNSGRVQNVTLTDNLPNGIQYLSGTLRVDGNSVNDNVNFLSLGTMNLGQSKTVTFQAKATAPANQASTTLTNTAIAKGDNVTDVQDTATVIINQVIGTPQLAITKNVKNITKNTGFQKNVTASNGDRVQFEIIISNPGSREVTNVRLNDNWTGNLQFNSVSVTGDVSTSTAGGTTGNVQASLGTLAQGQQRRILMDGTVNFSGVGTFNLNNTAVATGDNVGSVQDSASVSANQQGQPNLVLSKKAHNDTKNVDATTVPASREDFITYTLTVTNTGNLAANNFVITDDLSGVLPFADIVDNGGGSISNNVITYPSVTVPAGGSVSKSFKVRVKYSLAPNLTFTMVNTYGNTIQIQIQTPAPVPPVVSPKTGAGTAALGFGGISVAGYALWLKRKALVKLIVA